MSEELEEEFDEEDEIDDDFLVVRLKGKDTIDKLFWRTKKE